MNPIRNCPNPHLLELPDISMFATDFFDEGDYGASLFYSSCLAQLCTKQFEMNERGAVLQISHQELMLLSEVAADTYRKSLKKVDEEVEEICRRNKIALTDNNKTMRTAEHSEYHARFKELMEAYANR